MKKIGLIVTIPFLFGFQNCGQKFQSGSFVENVNWQATEVPNRGGLQQPNPQPSAPQPVPTPLPQQPLPTPVPVPVVTPQPLPQPMPVPVVTPQPSPTPLPSPTPSPIVNPVSPDSGSFISLHQYALKIAKKPAEGSYDYQFANYQGYKRQYDPDEPVTGCFMGHLKNSVCAFPWSPSETYGLNFTDTLIGYNVPKNFKFFITAGESSVMMAGYAPQRTALAFVIRYGQSPQRTQALSAAEYSVAQQNEKIDSSYARLIAGEEIIVVHDGGGTVRFLSGKSTAPLSGGWIYIRQLGVSSAVGDMQPGQSLYDLQLAVVAERNSFLNHYRRMNWSANGDPQ